MKLTLQLQAQLLSACTSIKNAAYLALSIALFLYTFKAHHDFLHVGLLSVIFILCFLLHYLYIRLNFDQKILLLMAEQCDRQHHTAQELSQQLDQALLTLNLITPEKTNRDWSLRFQGCIKLFKLQFAGLIIQYLCLFFLVLY